MNTTRHHEGRALVIGGRVQGVGFRPFVYRLAHSLGVTGSVLNASGEVHIVAEGDPGQLDRFAEALVSQAPPLARPHVKAVSRIALRGSTDFSILQSHASGQPDIHVPPDQFACDDCLREMTTPGERRHRYPFINCTQCGPRYTIIRAMPYDRPNTTMGAFALCPECGAEYTDPLDRRFHAQPLACPACGPSLYYSSNGGTTTGNDDVIALCIDDLSKGMTVAVKGIGGYHLICDATNDNAVSRLRSRKQRPSKPLAVMVPWHGGDGMDFVNEIAAPTPALRTRLADPERPIVLVAARADSRIAPSVAPGLREVGIMLPYSPLHHLLLDAWRGPLVATSGNISGEPVITDPSEAEARLSHVADAFLHHNRPIERPADDPVIRDIAGSPRPIRLGRGNAPLEMELPVALSQPVLATGAYLKNTIALAWGNRAVVSPHIGDLASPRSRRVFAKVAADLQALYGIRAKAVICDAHPGYANHRWAKDSGLPVTDVFHHHAHASALAGEHGLQDKMLVFTWDGVGLGEDGALWGGEALVGTPGAWSRCMSFRPFALPGGDRATHEPWRTALSLAWASGVEWRGAPAYPSLMRDAWNKGVGNPLTSAVGRLFDAAAAYAGLVTHASYEGEGPVRLEAIMDTTPHEFVEMPLALDEHGVLRADWAPLVRHLVASDASPGELSAVFHESMAQCLRNQARHAREQHGIVDVGLAGGVFQNNHLATRVRQLLDADGLDVHLPSLLPANDAAISFGQVIEFAMRGHRGIDRE